MNKKAIIAYFVLLAFVIIMYLYVSSQHFGITTTSTTTIFSSNSINSSSNKSSGSGGLIVNTSKTTVSSGSYSVISQGNATPVPVYPTGYTISPGYNYSVIPNHINGALFSSCIPNGGFSCTSPVLSGISGNLTVTISEEQYPKWVYAEIYLLSNTTEPLLKNGLINGVQGLMIYNISNSEQLTITIPAIKPGSGTGVQIQGNLWAVFHILNSNATYISELGSVSAQSV